MTRANLQQYNIGTAEYVVMHARYQASRGRRPSLAFRGLKNPREALALAQVATQSLEQTVVTQVQRVSTLVSEEVLKERCEAEGIDFSQVCVLAPRWAESKPREEGVRSALVCCDLIIREDGSVVYLDGGMGIDSVALAQRHLKGESNPQNLPWEEFVESIT